jgi:N-acetylmuramoyl-L-alanine amidase
MKDNKRFLTIIMLLLMVTLVAVGKTVTLATAAKTNKFTLVIDAGHGGNDAGAIGSLTKEKIINLNVALAFGKLVERNCSDVKVIYTRKTDVFIPLHTRADIANRNKADLFISIHTNALPKGRISRGLETYTLGMHRAADNLEVAKRENEVILYEKDYKQRYQGFDPNSSESYIMFEFIQDHNMAQSVEMAKYVQRRTCASAGRIDKGVKQAGFLVLRETSMPSCLIELGFISTPDEERFLNTTSGVNQLAQGIYQAFLDYKRKNYGGVTVPLKVEPKTEVEIPTVVPKAEPKAEVKPEPKPEVKAEPKPEVKTEPKPEVKPEVKTEPKPEAKPDSASSSASPTSPTSLSSPTTPAIAAAPAVPVFKVQILASSTKLKSNDPRLKGQKDAACYEEGGLYKYTVGSSANYNEIAQLRKTLAADFPQCFIIAFKDGAKVNVQLAIQEFRNNNKK